jgi:hypothetical protein
MNIHISITYNSSKLQATQHPSADERINKTWYTLEYYSVIKRSEELGRERNGGGDLSNTQCKAIQNCHSEPTLHTTTIS